MNEQTQDDRLETIYYSSVPIQGVALKTYRGRWMIETGGKRENQRDPCCLSDMMMMLLTIEEIVSFGFD